MKRKVVLSLAMSAAMLGGGAVVPVAAAAPVAPATRAAAQPTDTRAAALAARLAAAVTPERAAAMRQLRERAGLTRPVIDGSQYSCDRTPLDDWLDARLATLTPEDESVLFDTGLLMFPAVDAIYFGDADDPRYAPTDSAKTLAKTFTKLKAFWDIPSDDIDLVAMDPSMLLDHARVMRVLTDYLGVPEAQADALASDLVAYVDVDRFDHGRDPLFTLNAMAYTPALDPEAPGTAGDRIVMGSGIMELDRQLGYGDVGPQAILAHEFGHHVQFERALESMEEYSTPEQTRAVELQADAMSAYFLTHPRGLSMQAKRVSQVLGEVYLTGDCMFDEAGHHGTPNQRRRAAEWAYTLQETQRPKGRILPSLEFIARFDAALPMIVAPDA